VELLAILALRYFTARAVRWLATEAGIRRFLDIGVGLPVGNAVHEIAQDAAPGSLVVYADTDPLVLVHARALLTGPQAPSATSRQTCVTPPP
jgi:hypothetical protein